MVVRGTFRVRPVVGRTAAFAPRRPARPHPALHPLEQAVEFFGDPVEAIGGLARPLIGRPIFGRRDGVHAIRHARDPEAAGGQSHPLPKTLHGKFPLLLDGYMRDIRSCRTLVGK
jgi:hypothetical protein